MISKWFVALPLVALLAFNAPVSFAHDDHGDDDKAECCGKDGECCKEEAECCGECDGEKECCGECSEEKEEACCGECDGEKECCGECSEEKEEACCGEDGECCKEASLGGSCDANVCVCSSCDCGKACSCGELCNCDGEEDCTSA